jgi:flagellar hook-basal body complex protein FliE
MRIQDIGSMITNQVQTITEQAKSAGGLASAGSSRGGLDTFASSLARELQSQINTYSPQAVMRPDAATSSPTAAEVLGPDRAASTGVGEEIKNAIEHVNTLQQNADELSTKVATGSVEDTHKAMIAMERALMSLDFTLQVRNKVLDAYQEIGATGNFVG